MLITWKPGEVHAIHADMMQLTLRIVSKTLFDAEIADMAASLDKPIRDTLDILNDKFTSLANFPTWVPSPRNRREKRANDQLFQVVNQFIVEHRESGDRGDLLSMLIMARDEDGRAGMDDNQIYIEALTMFLAGHETTAVALMWTWYLLSQYPEA